MQMALIIASYAVLGSLLILLPTGIPCVLELLEHQKLPLNHRHAILQTSQRLLVRVDAQLDVLDGGVFFFFFFSFLPLLLLHVSILELHSPTSSLTPCW